MARSPFPSTLSEPTSERLQVGVKARFAAQVLWRTPVTDQDSSIGCSIRVLSPVARPCQTNKVLSIWTPYEWSVVSGASDTAE